MMTKTPRAIVSPVMSRERPGAMPLPSRRDISAFTRPQVYDRWAVEAAGVRSLAVDDNVITMFDVIGEDWWTGGGVTAKKVASQLRAIGDRPVEVHVNSPGGDMFEGIAIYNVLREHSQPVTVKVMGMAASAASVLAMAGDEILIGAASFLMIHNCWVVAVGNRHDMAETSAFLEPFDSAMADVYAERSKSDRKAIAKWMDQETYMSGSMAIERGFADGLLAADKITTDAQAQASDLKFNELRMMELQLVSAGLPRDQARARAKQFADVGATPPLSAEPEWMAAARSLLSAMQS